MSLVTVVIGCLILLAVVGVITKLVLGNISKGDSCPYCSGPLARSVRICPHGHQALGER